jgi:hypothetical protein
VADLHHSPDKHFVRKYLHFTCVHLTTVSSPEISKHYQESFPNRAVPRHVAFYNTHSFSISAVDSRRAYKHLLSLPLPTTAVILPPNVKIINSVHRLFA